MVERGRGDRVRRRVKRLEFQTCFFFLPNVNYHLSVPCTSDEKKTIFVTDEEMMRIGSRTRHKKLAARVGRYTTVRTYTRSEHSGTHLRVFVRVENVLFRQTLRSPRSRRTKRETRNVPLRARNRRFRNNTDDSVIAHCTRIIRTACKAVLPYMSLARVGSAPAEAYDFSRSMFPL